MKSVYLSITCVILSVSACKNAAATPPLPNAAEAEVQAFQKEMDRLFNAAQNMNRFTVKGRAHWLFPRNELRFLSIPAFWGETSRQVSHANNKDYADPLPAIRAFHKALSEKGISLILVPVPAKGTVYPECISDIVEPDAPFRRFDAPLQQFYAKLNEAGIQVVDLVPPLVKAKSDGRPLYCRTDSHWSPAACEITAGLVAKKLQTSPWYAGLSKTEYAMEPTSREITGDLLADLNDPEAPAERLELNQVGQKSGDELTAIEPDEESPVLLMGDSHTLVFHDPQLLASRAGLFDHLSAQLGFPLDLIGTRGSGATAVRIELFRRQSKARKAGGDYLAGKKAVIWCFSVREFTESDTGWRVVPLEK